jgi:hypothetical protein
MNVQLAKGEQAPVSLPYDLGIPNFLWILESISAAPNFDDILRIRRCLRLKSLRLKKGSAKIP